MTDPFTALTSALADRYTIERELGRGGAAAVFLAEDLRHHRKVALKILRPEVAEAVGPERFLREIEVAAGLTHPHIVPLYDSGDASGVLYFVMPFVEGESLRDRLERDGALPVEEAVRITRELADALGYAHAHGVIHRDVKPENVLLEAGHAVLADFGVASAVSEAGEERLTHTGVAVGTPAYMSPEQAAADRKIDGRADQYALGCLLYEMLTGQPPFAGPSSNSVMRQHVVATPVPVVQLRPSVPLAVAAVLDKAMAKAPPDRFGCMEAFTGALEGAPPGATTPHAFGRVRPFSKARLAGTISVVAVVGVTAAVMLRPSDPAPSSRSTIAVPTFENRTDQPDLGGQAARIVMRHLGAVPDVSMVPPARLEAERSRLDEVTGGPGDRPTLGEAVGAGTVVTGTITAQGDMRRIEAEILAEGGRRHLVSVAPVIVPPDSIVEGFEQVGRTLAATLENYLDGIADESFPFQLPTPSMDVGQKYDMAYDLFFQGDLEGSLRLAREILDEAPGFSPAVTQLAVLYLNNGEWAVADSVLTAAEATIPMMSPLTRSQWYWARATVDGERELAYRYSKDNAGRSPHPWLSWTWGFEALRTNRIAEASEVLSALDPDSPSMLQVGVGFWMDLTESLHLLEDTRRERASVEEATRRWPDIAGLARTRVRIDAAQGEWNSLRAFLDGLASTDLDPVRRLSIWVTAVVEARVHEHHREAEGLAEALVGQVDLQSVPRLERVRAGVALKRWPSIEAVIDSLAATDPNELDVLGMLGIVKAHLGASEEALRVSQRIEAIEGPYDHGRSPYWRACIAAALGQSDEAVRLLGDAYGKGLSFGRRRSATLFGVHADPNLDPLRGFGPFERLVKPKG